MPTRVRRLREHKPGEARATRRSKQPGGANSWHELKASKQDQTLHKTKMPVRANSRPKAKYLREPKAHNSDLEIPDMGFDHGWTHCCHHSLRQLSQGERNQMIGGSTGFCWVE